MQEIYQIAPKWRAIVESKIADYKEITKDLSHLTIILHNATWCPDCERESTNILALIEALGNRAPNLELHEYEDKQDYIQQKRSGSLSIGCLPTIIFLDGDKEIARIEESAADFSFKSL